MALAVSTNYEPQHYIAHIAPRLRRSSLFERFSEDQIRDIATVFTPCTVAEGEYLFKQGDRGDFMVIVAQGKLELHIDKEDGSRLFEKIIEPFELIGEMTCLDPAPRTGSIIALTTSEVLVLDRTSMDRLRTNSPRTYSSLLHTIWNRVSSRLRVTNEAISQYTDANGEVAFTRNDANQARGHSYKGRVTLDENDALNRFTARELDTIAGIARKTLYPAGSVICREGDLGKSCHIIVRGSVSVYRDVGRQRFEIGKLAAGDLFGQFALLDQRRRSATIEAAEDTLCIELDMIDFDRLIQAATPFALRFQELVTIAGIRQLRLADERYAG